MKAGAKTDVYAGHRFSTLKKIAALRAMELTTEVPDVVAEESSKEELSRDLEGTEIQAC